MHNRQGQRASIFQSFDSLKGFQEYLRKQEKVYVERKELSEDDYIVLDKMIRQIDRGDMVRVVYYEKGAYVEKQGMVARMDTQMKRRIQIVEKVISLDDIIEIEKLG